MPAHAIELGAHHRLDAFVAVGDEPLHALDTPLPKFTKDFRPGVFRFGVRVAPGEDFAPVGIVEFVVILGGGGGVSRESIAMMPESWTQAQRNPTIRSMAKPKHFRALANMRANPRECRDRGANVIAEGLGVEETLCFFIREFSS